MIDLAFFCAERTEFSDELYAVIGRALSIATHYEANLRALVVSLQVRQQRAELMEADRLEETVLKLWQEKLNNNIQKLMSRTKKQLAKQAGNSMETEAYKDVTDYLSRRLHNARKARNRIAHEATLGIDTGAEDNECRRATIDLVEEQVRYIAEADFYIAGVIEHLNHTNVMPSLAEYIESMVNWVCEV